MLLTEQEMTAFFPFGLSLCASDIRLVRAIESLVIAKIKAQGPVAYISEGGDVARSKVWMDEMGFKCSPLYAFPLYRLPEGD